MSKRLRRFFGRSKQSDHPTSHSGGQSTPDLRSSDQPTPGPYAVRQSNPSQQHITDPYGAQSLPRATSGGHPGPYSSMQLNPEPRSGQRPPNLSSSDLPSPDPRSGGQYTPNSHWLDQSIVYPYPGGQRNLGPTTSARDLRSSGQRTPDSRHSGHPASGPLPSGQSTPNQQRITDPYGGQSLPQATSGGHLGPYFSIKHTHEPRGGQRTPNLSSSEQPNPDARSGGQYTPNPHSFDQSIIYPYPGGQRNLGPITSAPDLRSSGQRTPDSRHSGQPALGSRLSDQFTPNQQRITDPYGGQSLPQATSGGHLGPYFSIQLTHESRGGQRPPSDQPNADARSGGQYPPNPHSFDQSIVYPYPGGQHNLVPTTSAPDLRSSGQRTPDSRHSGQPASGPRSSGQSTPNQQWSPDPYGDQPLPQATSGGHLGPYSSIQLTPEPRSGQRTPNLSSSGLPNPDSRSGGQYTLNPHSFDQSIAYPYPGGQGNLEHATSARSLRSSGQITPNSRPSGPRDLRSMS